ncbi:MAG: Lrp/AsnC family transcriptional regulator [Candidatus Bathyarchaeia archaeon]|jgi:DNA-binding Lrp family transcriptional regulator
MDKTDYRILSELLLDCTHSFVKIAKKIGVSPYTVRRRYEKMKKEGTIFSHIVTIDLSKIGYQGKAFLLITTSPNGNKSDIISLLKKIRNVIVVTETIGPYDILAIAPIIDLESIQMLLRDARKIPDVQNIQIACSTDVSFPIGQNFRKILSEKAAKLATT